MALSQKAKVQMVVAFSDRAVANEIIAKIVSRVALSKRAKEFTTDVLGPLAAADFNAAVVSGANLKLTTKRRVLIAMSDQALGNELINNVQSVAQSSPTKL